MFPDRRLEHRDAVSSPWLMWTPTAITLSAAAAFVLYGPITQPAGYHDFADQSVWLGVPHALDVLSNAGFAVVGLYGLVRVSSACGCAALGRAWPGYILFLFALVLTAAGSTFYHLEPSNPRLVWDRIPIALACSGLLSAVLAQSWRALNQWRLTTMLATVAPLTVWWWWTTDASGAGDLRPYLLLQGLPLILVPLWQTLHRRPRAERRASGHPGRIARLALQWRKALAICD